MDKKEEKKSVKFPLSDNDLKLLIQYFSKINYNHYEYKPHGFAIYIEKLINEYFNAKIPAIIDKEKK